ncbi:MAG: hypothetical protein ACI802_002534 [Candidatus Paceibacteria bacterium]|jgi:hypothetical protein
MNKNIDVEIIETAEFGTILKCHDLEVSDEFEDFLTEQCFVPFKVALQAEETSFFLDKQALQKKFTRCMNDSLVNVMPQIAGSSFKSKSISIA